jgi:hypothetical protein
VIGITVTCVTPSVAETCDLIENHRQEQDRLEREQRDERNYDYYAPSTTNLTDNDPLMEDVIQEESNPFPTN